ncbi:glycoside hydrolase family 71/99-like protein [Aquirufa sp. ROCK2-A2]
MHHKLFLLFVVFLISCSEKKETGISLEEFNVTEYPPNNLTKKYSIPVYAHYMPWFESPEFAEYPNTQKGNWGYHWTMASKNPNISINGKREIASHFYPLIGPYDNGEPDYLEYAVVCMKLSGLDGILIDYPGITEVNDWKLLHQHTLAIIPYLKKAGLKFGIVYEDAALKNAFEQKIISDKVLEAKRVMKYMNDQFFSDPNYIRLNNKPLLMNFGPQAIFTNNEWKSIFADIPSINFLPLAYHGQTFNLSTSVNGAYAWVDETMNNNFYNYCSKLEFCIGGAMPEFKDFYKEGGWGNGYTTYNALNGRLFEETLQRAKANRIDAIQIITWNDFGEGTMIEPTLEFGYSRLEQLQSFLGVNYSKTELDLAVQLYKKRKENKGKVLENKKLDQVFYYLVSLQIEKAKNLLNGW